MPITFKHSHFQSECHPVSLYLMAIRSITLIFKIKLFFQKINLETNAYFSMVKIINGSACSWRRNTLQDRENSSTCNYMWLIKLQIVFKFWI